jgi:hypothetical protein
MYMEITIVIEIRNYGIRPWVRYGTTMGWIGGSSALCGGS